MALSRAITGVAALTCALLGCTSTHVVLSAPDAGVVPLDVPFMPLSDLSLGVDHTCTVSSGLVRCSGSNRALALGLGEGEDRLSLAVVPGIDDAIAVGAGYDFTCVLRAAGRLSCFGQNGRSQLGTGDQVTRRAPTDLFLPAPVISFASAFEHTCAVLRTGALYCWGSNQEGELGQGETGMTVDRAIPVEVAPGVAFVEVSVGQGHTCAIANDGGLYCMGRNTVGELGLGEGSPESVSTPSRVGTRRYAHVAAGQNHTCAISADDDAGALYCWGADGDNDGYAGPLNLPGSTMARAPVRVGLERDWTAISTDTFHTCGLRGAALWCWGRNGEGQLGVGDMSVVADMVQVEPDAAFIDVEVGRFHTCARRDDGVVLCCGKNTAGELAVGDLDRRAFFTEVAE